MTSIGRRLVSDCSEPPVIGVSFRSAGGIITYRIATITSETTTERFKNHIKYGPLSHPARDTAGRIAEYLCLDCGSPRADPAKHLLVADQLSS